jgi:hypothetical protein
MGMTNQAKRLKGFLLRHGLGDWTGQAHVKTRRISRSWQGQRFIEWGRAEATVVVSPSQWPRLQAALRQAGIRALYCPSHLHADEARVYLED